MKIKNSTGYKLDFYASKRKTNKYSLDHGTNRGLKQQEVERYLIPKHYRTESGVIQLKKCRKVTIEILEYQELIEKSALKRNPNYQSGNNLSDSLSDKSEDSEILEFRDITSAIMLGKKSSQESDMLKSDIRSYGDDMVIKPTNFDGTRF